MVRRKRDPVTEAAAAAAAAVAATQADGITLEPADDDAELIEDVLEGLRRLDTGGDSRVTWYVYSQSAGKSGNAEGYIEKLRSDQLDEQRFKHLYGPGEYRIVGRTRDGSYVKGSHKVVRISDIGANDTVTETGNDAVALLREMRAADERRAQQRAETLKTTATIVATPLATILAALIARRPALDMPALITALRPQQNTLTEMTTALANLKQLEAGGTSNVDVVLKLLDRLQDLPSGQSEGWLGVIRDVVKEVAPPLREFVGQLGAQQAKPPQPGQPAITQQSAPIQAALPTAQHGNGQAPPPPQPTPASAASESDMFTLVEPWLRRKAEDLHDEAQNNMPVDLSAEHLLTTVDKKFGAMISQADLLALVSRPDWWEFVAAFHPPLVPFRAWVSDVRNEIMGMLQASIQDAGTEQTRKDQAT